MKEDKHKNIYTDAFSSKTIKKLKRDKEIKPYFEEIKGENERTAYIYLLALGRIKRMLRMPLKKAKRKDLLNIINTLKHHPSKHNTFISVMRDYYVNFLGYKYPKVGDKRFKRLAEYGDDIIMSPEEQDQFFEYLENHENPLWKCLFGGYAYSLRRGEGVYLYEKHVDKKQKLITVLPTKHYTPKHMRKGKRFDRFIAVNDVYLKWIKDWLKVRPEPARPTDKPLLFLNNLTEKKPGKCIGVRSTKPHRDYGYPLSVWLVNRKFKQLLAEAGLKDHYHPHTLRANYVTDLLDRKVPMNRVMLSSGHRETKNLEKYWRILDKKKAAKEVNVHPSVFNRSNRVEKSLNRSSKKDNSESEGKTTGNPP